MKSSTIVSLFVCLLTSFSIFSQVPIQKIDFPSTIIFGTHIDVTDDGQYLAVLSATAGASSKVYIYEMENNQYELSSIQNFTFEVTDFRFADDNETIVVGEGLGNIFRTARVYIIKLDESGEWIKYDSIIEDPEEMDVANGHGFNVSKNGKRVALGAPTEGKVYLYDILSPTEAIQLGEPLTTNEFFNFFGTELSLSGDGSRLAVSTFDPKLTEVFEYNNGTWDILHTVEFYGGRNQLSDDGKSLMVSNNNNIQIHTESEDGTWIASDNIVLNGEGNGWNIQSADFNPDYDNISVGMLNASNQNSKLAALDLVQGQWLERRSTFFDTEHTDYTGIKVASSIDGSLMITSSPRINNFKGEVYVYNDLEGSALGVAAFRDRNRNGVFDADEFLFTDCEFIVNGDLVLPALSGFNYASVFGATHNIEVSFDEDVYLTTTDQTYMFDHESETLTEHLFGLDYINPIGNSSIYSSNSLMLCNTTDENFINISNDGSIPFYVELEIRFEDIIFESSDAEILMENESMIVLKSPLLQPGEDLRITNVFQMPSETSTGETMALSITASTFEEGVLEPIDVKDIDRSFTLRCSYDPNDKAVFPEGLGEEKFTLIDQDLLYRVRFQNTGNFPATNVIVKDLIDDNLDISTFKFVEASHPVTQVSIRDRKVDFVFENIMLADSVNNESESHGYVLFSIRPFDNTSDYTLIENTAEIFFDFNSPIITNTTSSNMVESFPSVFVVDIENDNFNSQIFPNPVSEDLYLNIELDSEVMIFNQSGMLISKKTFSKGINSIPVEDLVQGAYYLKVKDLISGHISHHSFVKF